ncbi:MAG: hypothetical protein KIS67_05385 [Verrucomicrobiae bacterium]|nr:hypothetical protein [Verrucomicrobiae bacterium]
MASVSGGTDGLVESVCGGVELSNTLDSEFCIRAWTAGLATGRQPLISNTDQGSQFTSEAFWRP